MNYVDTSVVLAALFAEDRHPEPAFWAEPLVASRLVEYETGVRVNASGAAETVAEAARFVTGSIDLVEMTPPILARALEPFPTAVRTLEARHLATADYLRAQGMRLRVATYDARMRAAAEALGFEVFEP